jgi:hypothetical protein
MHDLGGLVWILIVAIAVFSSIRKNVRRVRNAQQTQARPMPQMQPPAPPPVAAPAVQLAPSRLAMAGFAMPPIDPLPAPPTASPKTVVAPAAAPRPTPFPMPAPVGTSPIRGMFGGSATLVRAIVAAEVLGPPKALQENTIWSPRHSEPSI